MLMNKIMFERKVFILFTLLLITGLSACSDDDDDLVGNWIRRSDFGGSVRGDASCVVVGENVYVIGGYNGRQRLNDVWEYDLDKGYWTQKADFPGTPRNFAAAFATEDKAYYGTGYDGLNYYKDFWEFDPEENAWTQKTDFPGQERHGATAFYLNGKGYVGTGFGTNYYMDFYKYDPAADTWSIAPSIQGTKRAFASNFIINNKAYVVGGINNGSYPSDFWMFNPTSETWEQKASIADKTDDDFDDDYTTITRLNAVALVIDGRAYLTTGETSGLNSYTWEYNPNTDRWTEKTSFEGTSRTSAVGFTLNNRGFLLTGRGSTSSTSLLFDDMWEFKPWDEYDEYD